jgi:hypothetical protein
VVAGGEVQHKSGSALRVERSACKRFAVVADFDGAGGSSIVFGGDDDGQRDARAPSLIAGVNSKGSLRGHAWCMRRGQRG